MKKLSIEYNSDLPLASVYPDPILFAQMLRYFPNFKFVVSDSKMDQYATGILADSLLSEHIVGIKPTSKRRGITEQKNFLAYAKKNSRTKYLMYQPKDPPYLVNPLNLLMNSPALARAYENKRYFRDEFEDLIRIPKFVIRHITDLTKVASFRDLRNHFGGSFVIQDEESSGSKGTFVIHSYDDFVDAVGSLRRKSSGRSLVISEFIKGDAYSTQVCITKYGIFTSGIQRQIVDEPLLCNLQMEGATRWCGGVLGDEYPDIVQHQTQEIATIVGSELASHGYKGVFGVDLIINPDTNEVYAIEINARLTGYSHLISDMQHAQGKTPFILLHTLELMNMDYEVKDLDALPSRPKYRKPISYLILHNQGHEEFHPSRSVLPGIYRVGDKGEIEFIKESYSVADLKNESQILVQSGIDADATVVQPGKRALKIVRLGSALTKSGKLSRQAKSVIRSVEQYIGLNS
jgi:hypothetical protein